MAKLTAWLVTLLGVVLVLVNLNILVDLEIGGLGMWIAAIAVLVIGVGKLVRNYKSQ